MLSAPPTAAANDSAVPRSMFTHGSRWLLDDAAVRAWSTIVCAAADAPEAFITFDQSRRAARSFAISAKKLPPTECAKWICFAASSMEKPAPTSRRT